MSWSSYGAFLALAALVVVIPGPDLAVVTRGTLLGGARRGRWTSLGIATASFLQGGVAAAGLGALLRDSTVAFTALRWAGVAYLVYLGAHAWRCARRGDYPDLADEVVGGPPDPAWPAWRQGFVTNATNPKVLVFYLAVLPQFLRPGAPPAWLLAFAGSHAALTLVYLCAVSTGLARLRRFLGRRRVRQTLDAATGTALIGFGAALALERL